MRFAHLMLERYGRFEDCSLVFRSRTPDLHVIYGPNEAGKSTTLAAVSDLLFGFGGRTAYDFRFDKTLLRVGAELEEDGNALVCRRRKGNAATLLDAEDRAIDEGALLAMMRGQTREGFRLAFSLDQQRLRLGGQAMVDAKDDVGQALFAAGSGLTEIAGELDRLNEEADAIWGRRGSKRSYAVAERDHLDAQRQMRDAALKPKAWADARAAAERTKKAQTVLEQERDVLASEQRRVERIRRVGPGLRRRDELLSALALHGGVFALTPQRESQADAAMVAVDLTDRQRAAAATLLSEATERAALIAGDDVILAVAERVEDLAERRGAFNKAAQDRARLVVERRAKEVRIDDFRRELGGAATRIPSRLALVGLRGLATRHAEASSGVKAMEITVADLDAREAPLRDRIADAVLNERLPALVAAMDAVHRLGADVDARCDASARAAARTREAAQAALLRLTPWAGTYEALHAAGFLAEDELADAQHELADLRSRMAQEVSTAARLDEEASTVALERATLGRDGIGVAGDALTTARSARDGGWQGIGEHLRGVRPLADSVASAEAYELAVVEADGVADLRFASAEASGRLAELESRRVTLELQAAQARRRGDALATELASALGRWVERTRTGALPALEPIRMRSWLADRQSALEAQRAALDAEDGARGDAAARSAAVARMLDAMPDAAVGERSLVAPLLAVAETIRRDGEARDAAFREDRAELREIERSLGDQRRRLAHAQDEVVRVESAWGEAQAEAGVDLAIATAEGRLAIIDELRAEIDAAELLDGRLAGIDAEGVHFEADVAALAQDVGEEAAADAAGTLTAIRRRLDSGRDMHRRLTGLAEEATRRATEVDVATAARTAALDGLAPLMAEIGVSVLEDVAAAVERSRLVRTLRTDLAVVEREVGGLGDGYPLLDLVAEFQASDPDDIARRAAALTGDLAEINGRISEAATASGEANRAFSAIEGTSGSAADSAADAEQARAEMSVQAEAYLLKRSQALTLRWAMDRFRERRQDPLLVRASQLFATLTTGSYIQLRIDLDGATPRLGGLCADGRSIVDVASMSEGTTDQLFLALRLAAMEQSVAAGVRLPFLADDLFVNFDDERAEAGFRVLAELAQSTQVLFFTHHPHLAAIAARVIGAELHSECSLVNGKP